MRESFRTIDLAEAGVPLDPVLAARRDETIRRALLALWLPRKTKTGTRQFKPTTWMAFSNLLLKLASWQFEHMPTHDGSVFVHFTVANVLTEVFPSLAPKERGRANLRALLAILIDAGSRGVISDWPRLYGDEEIPSDKPTIERGRRDQRVRASVEKSEPTNYQPFSDQFVSEFVRRGLWIHENIATRSIELWRTLRAINAEQARRGRKSCHPSVIAMRAREIAKFRWEAKDGHAIERLPFELNTEREGKTYASDHWPPQNSRELNRIVSTIQVLNYSLPAFCSGARSSEISAARDFEHQTSDDRMHSTTFKLIDEVGGRIRDWPLHPAAVRAIKLQQMLVREIRPAGRDHLWVILGHENKIGTQLFNLTEPLVQAVEHLGLSAMTGRDRAHMHRWRHTVARLVALSVVGAPQVLLDLFGHRDLDMTLRYMLSDPQIVEDAMKVARETSYAMAEEAISESLKGETAGPAAPALREGLASMRRGEKAFETSSLRETAEVLTFNGLYWSLVRPGVICTKSLGEYGPCTRQRGAPDPGSCRTACTHRLETARAKQLCEGALRALIDERKHAISENAEMLLANLDGQILAELKRWPDVRETFLAEHPDVRSMWEESL